MNENYGGVGLKQDLVDISLDIDALLNQITTNFVDCAKKRTVDDNLAQLTGLFCNKSDTFRKMVRQVNTDFAEEEKIAKLQETLADRDRVLTEKCEVISRGFEEMSSSIFKGKKAYNTTQKQIENSADPDQIIRYAYLISKNYSVAAPHFWQQGDPMRPFPTDMQFRFSALMANPGLNGPSDLHDDASTSDEEVEDADDSKDGIKRQNEVKDDEFMDDSEDSSSPTPSSDHDEPESSAIANKAPSSGYNVGVMSSDEDSSDSDD
uniref:Mediator of RNA polymerase II transcription subunit 4 n=1 Tax=Panagrellus redivivus TaxID=6233 RepID=A0A7E4WBV9_PANRE